MSAPRVTRTNMPRMFAVGRALIVPGLTPAARWHVIDRDADKWGRYPTFRAAVRAARAAEDYAINTRVRA